MGEAIFGLPEESGKPLGTAFVVGSLLQNFIMAIRSEGKPKELAGGLVLYCVSNDEAGISKSLVILPN